MPKKRLATLGFAVAVLAVLVSSPAVNAFTSNSLTVQVYSDGSVLVTQDISVSTSTGTVNVPLLTPVLSDVVATDQNGSALSWTISGGNITIYTLGATGVTLNYETLNLTNKTGTIWTLGFTSAFNTTVVLPKSSTVSSISGTPYSLQVQGGSPVADVSPGTWKINYGVPLSPQTSSTGTVTAGETTGTTSNTTTSGTGNPQGGTGGGPGSGFLGVTQTQSEWILAAAAVLVIVAVALIWWRRRLNLGPQGAELRPDDVKVLNFIQEQGGKVLEPEIRTKFALPKTSGWRQIKRLERMGYVKVTKIGSQNQIELIKKREDSQG